MSVLVIRLRSVYSSNSLIARLLLVIVLGNKAVYNWARSHLFIKNAKLKNITICFSTVLYSVFNCLFYTKYIVYIGTTFLIFSVRLLISFLYNPQIELLTESPLEFVCSFQSSLVVCYIRAKNNANKNNTNVGMCWVFRRDFEKFTDHQRLFLLKDLCAPNIAKSIPFTLRLVLIYRFFHWYRMCIFSGSDVYIRWKWLMMHLLLPF